MTVTASQRLAGLHYCAPMADALIRFGEMSCKCPCMMSSALSCEMLTSAYRETFRSDPDSMAEMVAFVVQADVAKGKFGRWELRKGMRSFVFDKSTGK